MENMEEDTSNEITPSVIKILENFLDSKYGQQKYKYKIEAAAKKGDNYMGVIYRVIVFPLNDNEANKQSLILKVPPLNPLQRNQFFARAGFLREALAYEEVGFIINEEIFKITFTYNTDVYIKFLPTINDFQNSKGLVENEKFFEYPQCYFTSIEDLYETICMNDLQVDGFFMHNRFESLTLDHVTFIMRIYGKLHATSIAMKDQCPDKFQRFKSISDIFEQRKDDVQLNDYFESLKRTALESLDKNKYSEYWAKLNEYFNKGKFFDLMLDLLNAQSSEPYAVICHGDCWINNVMFKQEVHYYVYYNFQKCIHIFFIIRMVKLLMPD